MARAGALTTFYIFHLTEISDIIIHSDANKSNRISNRSIPININIGNMRIVEQDIKIILFLLAIVLSVLLRYTDSDYPFGIFNLFLANFMYSYRSLVHTNIKMLGFF